MLNLLVLSVLASGAGGASGGSTLVLIAETGGAVLVRPELKSGDLRLVRLGRISLTPGIPDSMLATDRGVGIRFNPPGELPNYFEVRSLSRASLPVVLSFTARLGSGFRRSPSGDIAVDGPTAQNVTLSSDGLRINFGAISLDAPKRHVDLDRASKEIQFARAVGAQFPTGGETGGGVTAANLLPTTSNYYAAANGEFSRIALHERTAYGTTVRLYDTVTKRRLAELAGLAPNTLSMSRGVLVCVEQGPKPPYPCAIYRASDGKLLRRLKAYVAG